MAAPNDEDLLVLLSGMEEEITDFRGYVESLDPPETAAIEELEWMQQTYACLAELRGWRKTHPSQKMNPVFFTNYGPQRLQ